jgi:hypothetical protein
MDAHFGQPAAVPSLRFHAIWAVSQRPRAAFETAASAKALAPVLDVADRRAQIAACRIAPLRRQLRLAWTLVVRFSASSLGRE